MREEKTETESIDAPVLNGRIIAKSWWTLRVRRRVQALQLLLEGVRRKLSPRTNLEVRGADHRRARLSFEKKVELLDRLKKSTTHGRDWRRT